MLPRDVPTPWNSTYDMLLVFIQFRKYIDAFTADRDNGFWEYELSEDEWKCLEELVNVLQVRPLYGVCF